MSRIGMRSHEPLRMHHSDGAHSGRSTGPALPPQKDAYTATTSRAVAARASRLDRALDYCHRIVPPFIFAWRARAGSALALARLVESSTTLRGNAATTLAALTQSAPERLMSSPMLLDYLLTQRPDFLLRAITHTDSAIVAHAMKKFAALPAGIAGDRVIRLLEDPALSAATRAELWAIYPAHKKSNLEATWAESLFAGRSQPAVVAALDRPYYDKILDGLLDIKWECLTGMTPIDPSSWGKAATQLLHDLLARENARPSAGYLHDVTLAIASALSRRANADWRVFSDLAIWNAQPQAAALRQVALGFIVNRASAIELQPDKHRVARVAITIDGHTCELGRDILPGWFDATSNDRNCDAAKSLAADVGSLRRGTAAWIALLGRARERAMLATPAPRASEVLLAPPTPAAHAVPSAPPTLPTLSTTSPDFNGPDNSDELQGQAMQIEGVTPLKRLLRNRSGGAPRQLRIDGAENAKLRAHIAQIFLAETKRACGFRIKWIARLDRPQNSSGDIPRVLAVYLGDAVTDHFKTADAIAAAAGEARSACYAGGSLILGGSPRQIQKDDPTPDQHLLIRADSDTLNTDDLPPERARALSRAVAEIFCIADDPCVVCEE